MPGRLSLGVSPQRGEVGILRRRQAVDPGRHRLRVNRAISLMPRTGWTWYVTEFDGEDSFFGYVVGFEKELGYFSLSELQGIRGALGLPVERDLYFEPKPLSEVKKFHNDL